MLLSISMGFWMVLTAAGPLGVFVILAVLAWWIHRFDDQHVDMVISVYMATATKWVTLIYAWIQALVAFEVALLRMFSWLAETHI